MTFSLFLDVSVFSWSKPFLLVLRVRNSGGYIKYDTNSILEYQDRYRNIYILVYKIVYRSEFQTFPRFSISYETEKLTQNSAN